MAGDKLDAVVCDGDSNETQASTVVNCAKIDEGEYYDNDADVHLIVKLL